MNEATVAQLFLGACTVLAALFGMQKEKHRQKIAELDKKHADDLKIVREKKEIATASHVSNNRSLERLDRSKDDIFSRFDRLEKKLSWLEEIIPVTNDLLHKIHNHFEARKTQNSQVKVIGPDIVRVEEKK